MAMPVDEYFSGKAGRLIAMRMMFQEVTEKERLASQSFGARVCGKQIPELIAKDGGTTRLQDDH